MKKHSAGIIVYRMKKGEPEVLIAHMGSPWWAKKDKGAWTIPKGGVAKGEEPIETARREFKEELGYGVPEGRLTDLGDIEQKNNKIVTAWAVEGDFDANKIKSILFEAEWPPRSGKKQMFPEIDRAAWMNFETAAQKIIPGQVPLLERLAKLLDTKFEAAKEPTQSSLF